MNRFLLRAVLTGILVFLGACSGPEKTEDPVATELKPAALGSRDDGPPLGNPRDKVNPAELLEGVDATHD